MLYFSAMVLAPNSFYYAPILLPFALGNGVTAAAVYASLDVMGGGPQALAAKKLGPIPLAGPVIGGATAVIAPFTFPVSMAVVWPDGPIGTAVLLDPETYRVIDSICMNKIALPCLGMTGFAAGLLIHVGLKPVIVGIPGFAWQKVRSCDDRNLLAPIFLRSQRYAATLFTAGWSNPGGERVRTRRSVFDRHENRRSSSFRS